MRRVAAAVVLIGTCSLQVGLGAQGRSETREVADRLSALDTSVRALEKEVSALSTLLRAALPPSPVEEVSPFDLNVAHTAVKGSKDAKLVIVEFSDFQCPYCGQHAATAYQELQKTFVDSGKIKYLFWNMPSEGMHPAAFKAAEAAACAGEQGKFWEMHDRLFANQQALKSSDLIADAVGVGVNGDTFQSCFEGGKTTAKIREDLDEARKLGLTGTPTFLIGSMQSDGTVHVVRRIVGIQPFQTFKGVIDDLLAQPTLSATK